MINGEKFYFSARNLAEQFSEIRMTGQTWGMDISLKSGFFRDLDIKFPKIWRYIMICCNIDKSLLNVRGLDTSKTSKFKLIPISLNRAVIPLSKMGSFIVYHFSYLTVKQNVRIGVFKLWKSLFLPHSPFWEKCYKNRIERSAILIFGK